MVIQFCYWHAVSYSFSMTILCLFQGGGAFDALANGRLMKIHKSNRMILTGSLRIKRMIKLQQCKVQVQARMLAFP